MFLYLKDETKTKDNIDGDGNDKKLLIAATHKLQEIETDDNNYDADNNDDVELTIITTNKLYHE